MFGTMIHDKYKLEDIKEMRKAINELTSATDSTGWASCGVYFYRDISTNEILYIGLATDLQKRFGQHNGLLSCKPGGCKYKNIQDYFKTKEEIGITIFVQSSINQTSNARSRKSGTTSNAAFAKKNMQYDEGYFIQLHKQVYGNIPLWNRANGDVGGQNLANNSQAPGLLNAVNPTFSNPFSAKHSITYLAEHPGSAKNEEDIHLLRFQALNYPNVTFAIAAANLKASDPVSYKELSDYYGKTFLP